MTASTVTAKPAVRANRTAPLIANKHPLFGHLNAFNNDTLNFLERNRDKGPIVRFKFGPFDSYLLNTPELTHEMLVKQSDVWRKSPVTRNVMYSAVGDGLFTSEGELWKSQRRMIAPLFHTKHVPSYGDTMANLTADLIADWKDGETRYIDHDFTVLAMQIISKVLFDADISQSAPEVERAVAEVLKAIEVKFGQIVGVPEWIPTANNRALKENLRVLDSFIQSIINQRRKLTPEQAEEKSDLLTLLLNVQDEDGSRMSDKQVRDESMTFFGAGHETTAATLTWISYLLSQHPQVQSKLHEELDRALNGRLPGYHDLVKLPYTEQIVKEAMRLYPVAWSVFRVSTAESTLGGLHFPTNSVALVNIWGIHRDPKLYDQAESFIPERWTPEFEKSLPKQAYMPFGGGPRICIGNAFAMMEARLATATVAQKFALELAPNFEVIPTRQFTTKPKNGMQMIVHAR